MNAQASVDSVNSTWKLYLGLEEVEELAQIPDLKFA
jgi:hypothetical protein